jgi:hypothetical protein
LFIWALFQGQKKLMILARKTIHMAITGRGFTVHLSNKLSILQSIPWHEFQLIFAFLTPNLTKLNITFEWAALLLDTQEFQFQTAVWRPPSLSNTLCSFPQSLQTNSIIVTKTKYDNFLAYPLYLIIHYHVI